MSTDDHWIKTRITESRAHHPLITEAVSSRMVELLTDRLSEQQFSQTELKELANALITDMAPPTLPKTDANR